mgnify:CR=1 FL=1
MKGICRIAGKISAAVTVIILLVICISYIVGIRADVVVSGSMEPEIMTGSICLTDCRDKQIEKGDIIAYRLDDITVTHRVIGSTNDGYITKGDNNDTPDIAPVSEKQIIGKNIGSIKNAGYIVFFLRSKTGTALLLGTMIVFSMMSLLSEKKHI